MHILINCLFILTIFPSGFCGKIDKKRKCIYEDSVTAACNHIPTDIPPGILRIRVTGIHFTTNREPMIVRQANFSSRTWTRVEYLEINDFTQGFSGYWIFEGGCFSNLTELKELHIHSTFIKIFGDTFIGLDKVIVLDLSECVRLERSRLLPALNGSNKLPQLRTLVLRNWNSYHIPYKFDETFVQTLLPRRLTHLDISSTHVSSLNFSAIFKNLKYLEVLNISYANVEEVSHRSSDVTHSDIKQLRVFDLSYSIWPRQAMPLVPAVYLVSNIDVVVSKTTLNLYGFLFMAQTVNISGIIPHYTDVSIENVTFTYDENITWFVKNFIMRRNNMKRLDVQCFCNNFKVSSIEHFDISDNGLEFIHPTFLYCMPNLQNINLAKNKLFKMKNENETLFGKLFLELNHLKYITLSANDLNDLPLNTFTNCRNVEVINLSNNKLSQVTFMLNDLYNLEMLDLQNNNINTLDHISLNRLNYLWRGDKSNEFQPNLILRSNPLSCSQCATRSFIEWLTSKMLSGLKTQGLTCSAENGEQELITENTLKTIQKICDRKTVIISSTISTAGVILVVIFIVIYIYKRRQRLKQKQTRAETIDLLQQGQGRYQFMTFLSFSSDDEEFVENHILRQLNEHLQRVTGIERQLVCTGDRNFRPGLYVHDEMDSCLENSSVVILVISNNFCSSEYCCKELDQACIKGKPVILMFIEEVEVEMMTPRMKELYKRNVRLLWTRGDDGEYVMKTTWGNACESILQLIMN